MASSPPWHDPDRELRLPREGPTTARALREIAGTSAHDRLFARYTFGDEPLVVLTGAWATGLTTAIVLEKRGLVKITRPGPEQGCSTPWSSWAGL